MPDTAKIASATMGCGTALEMPDTSLTGSAASQMPSTRAAAEGVTDVEMDVATYSPEIQASIVPAQINSIRIGVAAMTGGTAADGTDMTLDGAFAGLMPEGRSSTETGTSLSADAGTYSEALQASLVAGFLELERCDVTVTDVLSLDLTLSDSLTLDVRVD